MQGRQAASALFVMIVVDKLMWVFCDARNVSRLSLAPSSLPCSPRSRHWECGAMRCQGPCCRLCAMLQALEQIAVWIPSAECDFRIQGKKLTSAEQTCHQDPS